MIEILVCSIFVNNCEYDKHIRKVDYDKMKKVKIEKTECILGYEITKDKEVFYMNEKKVCVNE